MATAVRTLVHDTKSSKSLLTQLKQKDVSFVDSAGDFSPSNLMSQALLLSIQIGSRGGGYVASLDRAIGDEPRLIPFDQWWHKIVFANMGEQPLTRKDVVLLLANKDGGAHVDPSIDAHLARVSRLNALQTYEVTPDGTERPITRPELPAMRQIAHEVLRALIPSYRKEGSTPPFTGEPAGPGEQYSVTMSGPYIDASKGIVVPHRYTHRVGRNEPCPCGSGMKYKFCCGYS